MVATVEGGRVTALRGDPAHPFTRGFLCYRTNRFLERQYSAERLTTPLIRSADGVLKPASTDEALDRMAALVQSVIARHGPAAIMHQGGGGSLGMLKACWGVLLRKLGPITETTGSLCVGAGYEAQNLDFGGRDSPDPEQIAHAKQIVVWGKDLHATCPHLIPYMLRAKKAGARVLVIDPLVTRATEIADESFHPAPGSDIAIGLAALRIAFERRIVRPDARERVVGVDALETLVRSGDPGAWRRDADLPEGAFDRLIDALVSVRPTMFLVGWGLQRRALGATTMRVLAALAYLLGDVGTLGGGFFFAFTRKRRLDLTWADGPAPARTIPTAQLARGLAALKDPPVELLFVENANPVAQHPDSTAVAAAISRVPHVVVAEQFLTDTARLAEIVLPVATMLEEDDLVGGYGQPYLGLTKKVVEPLGEAASDVEWCRRLAEHLGLDASRFSAETLIAQTLVPSGLSRTDLERGSRMNPGAPANGIPFEDGLTFHRDAKFHAVTDIPQITAPDPAYPLWLFSVSDRARQNSQSFDIDDGGTLEPATVHPDAAKPLGLRHGDIAQLESPQGRLTVRLRFDHRQRRDTIRVAKGGALKHGRAVNVLTSDALTDLGEGAAYYDTRVRIDRPTR